MTPHQRFVCECSCVHVFYLPVSVCVSGFLSQPVNGVKVLISSHVRKRLVQKIHQVPRAVHLLSGSRTADTCTDINTLIPYYNEKY